MHTEPGTIRVRLSAAAPQVEVLTPLAIALGARAGLTIEQIDDLSMALELVVRRDPARARDAGFEASGGRLEVILGGVDAPWLDRHRAMLEVLVSEVGGEPGCVRLLVLA